MTENIRDRLVGAIRICAISFIAYIERQAISLQRGSEPGGRVMCSAKVAGKLPPGELLLIRFAWSS